MKHIPTLLWIALSTGLAAVTYAQRIVEPDGSVLLPTQKTIGYSFDDSRQRQLTHSDAWNSFARKHGSWSVQWNEATGTPHRAFGRSIKIPGYNTISATNVREAALSFLSEHESLLGIDVSDLKFVRATEVNRRWYVSFTQLKEGIDVLLSEVELRLSSDAGVMAFGSDFYRNISLPLVPTIPWVVAKENAKSGLHFDPTAGSVTGDDKVYVLPVRNASGLDYHLVYKFVVEPAGENPMDGIYTTYVDAHTGEVIWRLNEVHTEVRGRASGDIQLVLPYDPYVDTPLSAQSVSIGGSIVVTDSNGRFSQNITSQTNLVALLQGPYINVDRYDGPDGQITMSVNPNDSVWVYWTDLNSHPAERDVFYHTNLVLRFLKSLDTMFVAMNYVVPCVVNYPLTCNAQWRGNEGMRFYAEGGGCLNTAQMPGVVYHEYGHGVNQRLYEQLRGLRMLNGAANEGTADVLASLFEDYHLVGRGFMGPGTFVRNVNNTNRYPQNVNGQVHNDGLIIGGTFWDLRQLTSLATARRLAHFAKYGTPDDPDLGTAYSEWFLETIIADDDDGNLGNGTPNLAAILEAFDRHGIGSSLFFTRSFSHTPIQSTNDTTNAYEVFFVLGGTPIPGGSPDSVLVHYSIDNFQNTVSVSATEISVGEYRAFLPAQPGGTLMKYYITAFDPLGNRRFTFPATAPQGAYAFMIGAHPTTPGIMYAASTGSPGKLYHINRVTGAATLAGPLGITELHGLAVRPSNKELIGVIGGATSTTLHRVSPAFGASFAIRTLDIPYMRAIEFLSSDEFYGATTSGRLYRVNIETGDTVFIGTATGIMYSDLAINPTTGVLWASVRPPIINRDRIYTVNTTTGAATLVGSTGDGFITPAITFDHRGILYGLKGTATQTNTIILIDTATAAATLLGSTGESGLMAIALRSDSALTAVNESRQIFPVSFELSQNYPNPFNPSTTIRFGLPTRSFVSLKVFDILGRQVGALAHQSFDAGYHNIVLDATGLATGVYLYRLEASGSETGVFVQTRKMLIVK